MHSHVFPYATQRAWEPVLDDLERGALDIAVVPIDTVPARFIAQTIYEESFVNRDAEGPPVRPQSQPRSLLRDAAPRRVAHG
jgi:DNA-binding transcriptional LysR family regulator